VANLPTLEPDAAPKEVVDIYHDFQRRMGFPAAPNFVKTQGHSLAAIRGTWGLVQNVLVGGILPRTLKEMMFVAISQSRNCRYCEAAHLACCLMLGIEPSALNDLVSNVTDISHDRRRDGHARRRDVHTVLMSSVGDIARLNVLIEFFSVCANSADLETLLQVASGRLRWVIDFDRCAITLVRPEGRVCWIGTHAEESLHRVMLADLPETEATLVARVLETGVPADQPPGGICVPLQMGRRTFGAICFSTGTGAYTYRDMRLGHHAAKYLGSLICRLDLEEETRRLSQRKDDMLALLSHELRNPLAPIVTAVHLLRMSADGKPTKELDVIDRQAQHLVRLVDDLLDVARLTRGKMVLQRAPVEMSEVVALAVEMVSPLLEERRHSLAIDVPYGDLMVDVDKNRLAQVVSNLLSNAARYTEPGGHLAVAARRDGDTAVIEVSDDGVGIATEALSSIFDLFVRGASRSSGEGGLGLGLAIVKQLTELHGGSVSVASDGHGTKFTVRLPALSAGSVASTAPASSVVPRTDAPLRVLLVDDDVDALDLLALLVRRAGHDVAIANGGPDALALLERFRPSVAVIDIGMPVMNGYELAARIRAQRNGERPFLIALTGYGQANDHERGRAAGFNEHLVKPVDPPYLLRVMARAEAHVATSENAAE
jgi:AhpD family alkylhydroperoxidase